MINSQAHNLKVVGSPLLSELVACDAGGRGFEHSPSELISYNELTISSTKFIRIDGTQIGTQIRYTGNHRFYITKHKQYLIRLISESGTRLQSSTIALFSYIVKHKSYNRTYYGE